jgi:hypothetical protein
MSGNNNHNNSGNNNQGGGRNTPKNNYANNTSTSNSSSPGIPSGVLIYAIASLIFCTLFNLIYVTGMVDFSNDSFDTIVSTLGVILPVTAAVFISINMND